MEVFTMSEIQYPLEFYIQKKKMNKCKFMSYLSFKILLFVNLHKLVRMALDL